MTSSTPSPSSSSGPSGTAPRRLSRGAMRMIAALAGIMVVAFVVGLVPRWRRHAELRAELARSENARLLVTVALPRPPTSRVETTLPGNIEALQETTIYARTSGYLRSWRVDIGDAVKQGQLLAEIDTPELDQQLTESRANAEHARAVLAQAKASETLARATAVRYRKLAESQLAAPQEVDEKEAALGVAQANLQAAAAAIRSADARVARLVDEKGFARIVAPFAGIITARTTEVGALITVGNSQGQALFRLARVDPMRLFVHVPQVFAPNVGVGGEVKLSVRGLPGRVFVGKVARTSQAIDLATRTMLTEIRLPNPDRLLMPGMYGQVAFVATRAAGTLVIPAAALIFDARGTRVAVVDEAGRVGYRRIRVDEDYGTELSVAEGLGLSDRVVTNPSERLVEGLVVTVKEEVKEEKERAAKP